MRGADAPDDAPDSHAPDDAPDSHAPDSHAPDPHAPDSDADASNDAPDPVALAVVPHDIPHLIHHDVSDDEAGHAQR
ncbi:hypothetical protein [Streptomyces sp. NPDC048560]|uniref:hypothetical protein n=1 Tax=Streptomyces sp. NPDC048560 TaxID=3155488 RepID=UPI00342F9EC1